MPNPPVPTVPNITTGAYTGRVATDRYDFEKHIIGTDFNHDGYAITLDPVISINSIDYSDVHSAIEALSLLITPPVVPDATTGVKGIIRLSGDLGGTGTTALTPKVSGLQGRPVNTSVPTLNQVLTWGGASWGPATVTTFTPGGDLTGNSVSQNVVSAIGASTIFQINCQNIGYNSTLSAPTIQHISKGSGSTTSFTIASQGTSQAGLAGGDLRLVSGNGGAGGLTGKINLITNSQTMLQVSMVAASQRVLGLVPSGDVTISEMPAGTGDMVVYIKECLVPPTSGIPLNGAILYSRSSGLWTKNQSGQDFAIGSSPNPTVWGTVDDGYVLEVRVIAQSVTASLVLAYSKPFVDLEDCVIKVEAVIIGKEDSSTAAAIYNLVRGYVTNGPVPTAMGSTTSTDPRSNGAGSGWTAPSITILGNVLEIYSGADPGSATINWFLNIKITARKSV